MEIEDVREDAQRRVTCSMALLISEAQVRMHLVSSAEIDAYLSSLDEPKQSSLRELRATILEVVPEAEQCISYGMPGFKMKGKMIAGFAAFKNHLSYFPHSGSVLAELQRDLAQYSRTKSALQFPVDSPLPKGLVEKLIAIRVSQAFAESSDAPNRRKQANE